MIIATAKDIIKSFGVEVILNGVSFHINENDKIGLVGINGAGKTTLLKILANRISYDRGELFISNNLSIGYLEQNSLFDSANTIYAEMLSVFSDLIDLEKELRNMEREIALLSSQNQNTDKLLASYSHKMEEFQKKNGYGYISEIKGVLNGLGFSSDYMDKDISTLSGGEKTRLSLGKLLLKKPQFLILDEPTNHLDMESLQWLEQYLKTYNGTVLIISHDRYFLDQTVSRIFELENRILNIYEGNYSTYLNKKENLKQQELKLFEKQQKEIKKQEEIIRRLKQHGTEKLAKRAKSREKLLDHVEVLEKPSGSSHKISVHFKPQLQSGKDVLTVHNLKKTFENKSIFRNVSFDIKRGDRVCIIGPNGVGKTTLLKIILSSIKPDDGEILIGHNVITSYFDQEQKLLNDNNTVIEEIHKDHVLYSETQIRSILGAFLFRNDDVFKQISVLSGGERSRLSLLKLMMSNANFLIMDEPTNHLDIESKEIFEKALLNYSGTLLIVSHDRFFLNRIPNRILELTETGINEYLGNYDYYIEKKKLLEEAQADAPAEAYTKTRKREEIKKEKERQLEQKRKRQNLLQLESEISHTEERIKEIQHEMCKHEVYSNEEKSRALHMESSELKAKLEILYNEWETLIEQ
ncbi:MAG: ABC-F family ATP-binding cassette domain-containing protein [Clostridiales bacterium]|nr:ABC-F family ATP-binding cassette domain-containing protein [Clostridiales bacterium]